MPWSNSSPHYIKFSCYISCFSPSNDRKFLGFYEFSRIHHSDGVVRRWWRLQNRETTRCTQTRPVSLTFASEVIHFIHTLPAIFMLLNWCRRIEWKLGEKELRCLKNAQDFLRELVKALTLLSSFADYLWNWCCLQSDGIQMHTVSPSYGKGFMKKQKISPDGYIQMCVNLAFYNMHKFFPKTYEPATSRCVWRSYFLLIPS